ncbi:DNA polymerase [Mycolicibacterium porcinum]|uniref:DNA polymerase I n=2 Tax=Mycolicibacterium porcinum TaxID=39693 RepID=A0ABV3V9U5_9MYCO
MTSSPLQPLPDCPALPPTAWMPEPVLVPSTLEQVRDALNYLARTRGDHAIGFDTETTGTGAEDTVRLVQFATTQAAVVIRVERLPEAVGAVREWLDNAIAADARLTAHNMMFDAEMLHRLGAADAYELACISDDTLLMARLVEGARGDGDADAKKTGTSKDATSRISERNAGSPLPRSLHGLKTLTEDWLDTSLSHLAQLDMHSIWEANGWTATPKKNQQAISGWRNVSADSLTYLRYAGADAIDTARLHSHLHTAVQVALGESVAVRERKLYAWTVARKLGGFRVDVDGLSFDPDEEARTKRLDELNTELAELGVEPTKPKSLADAIELELTGTIAEPIDGELNPSRPQKRNDKGDIKDSIAADVVKPFADRSHIAALVMERAPLAKVASTYGEQWLKYVSGDRMYPAIDSHGSTTGRLTMSTPSLLNVPAHMRRFIIPRDGYTLIAGDLKAIEVRVGGGHAGDSTLIADLQAGRDPYGVVAELVFGDNYTKADRNAVKPVLLGRIYGRQPESVATQRCNEDPTRDYDTELALAYRIIAGIDSRWSELHRAGARLKARVQSGCTRIKLPSGRSIPVDPTHAKDALNALVQGSARDLLVDAGLRLLDMGYPPNSLLLAVHDEWVMEVPDDQVERACSDLETALTTTFMGVPVDCEVGVLGRHWGKL